MPRALVVTYPWLPAFNGGVKHVATLVRYLPEAGWDPIILARDFTDGPVPADDALHLTWPPADDAPTLRAVRALPTVRVPFARRENRATRWRASLDAPPPDERPRRGRRLARAALEATYPLYGDYPDEFRGWVGPAVSAGVAAVRQYGIGAVVSVSGPDSAHIAGGEIARAAGIPWIPLFSELGGFRLGDDDGRTLQQRLVHRALARRYLRDAARAAAATPALRTYLEQTYGLRAELVGVPFDPEDRRVPPRRPADAPLRVVHLGRVDLRGAPLATLREALDALLSADAGLAAALRVEFVGSGCDEALALLLAGRPAAHAIHFTPAVSPAEAMAVQREADVLLLLDRAPGAGELAAAARHPVTLFEALIARRPVVAVATDDGYLAQVLAETRAGGVATSADAVAGALRAALAELRDAGEVTYRGDEAAIARYGGPEQARRLAALLDVASAERIGTWQRS